MVAALVISHADCSFVCLYVCIFFFLFFFYCLFVYTSGFIVGVTLCTVLSRNSFH